MNILLAVVVGVEHVIGDIEPCIALIIEGRGSGRGEHELLADTVNTVFLHEERKVGSIAHGSGGQHEAASAVPHFVVEHLSYVLRSTAKSEYSVLIDIYPYVDVVLSMEDFECRKKILSYVLVFALCLISVRFDGPD